MSLLETALVSVPLLGLALAIGVYRKGRPVIGAAVLLATITFASIPAVHGNARPIVSLVGIGFFAAFTARAENRDWLTLACFSAFFVTMSIVAMYT
jgi:diacylglycerol kinase family enzyme